MNEAQWPNTAIGALKPATATITSVYSSAIGTSSNAIETATIGVANLPGAAGAWDGATIHIGAGQGWVVETGTVLNSGNGTITFSYLHHDSFETPTVGNHFYLTGKFLGLDAAGEWYRDSSGNLYLWTPNGASPTTDTVEAKRRQYAFELTGRSYIVINNIHIIAASIDTSATSSHIVISALSAKYVSQQMLNPFGWIDGADTTGILLLGSSDVYLGGSNNIVEDTTIAYTDYSGTDEAAITMVGSYNQILSNTIYDTGRDGILNTDATYAHIEYNNISSIGLQDTDLGAIYDYGTDSHGTVIAYNTISNIHTGGYGGDGIYLDNGSADYVVYKNTINNVQLPLHLNPPSDNNSVTDTTINGKLTANSSSGGGSPKGNLAVYTTSKAKLTTLGTLGGFKSYGLGINYFGEVVGGTMTSNYQPAYSYNYPGGTLTPINAFGSAKMLASAVSVVGQIVGDAILPDGHDMAFLDSGGTVSALGTLAGDTNSAALAINSYNQVVGVSYDDSGLGHAFIDSNGKMSAIGTLGGNVSSATGINNAGTVVGNSTLAGDRDARAFSWSNGVMKDLGTLGGSSSYATAINNAGEIVGASLVSGNSAFHAFIYSNGVMHNLGTIAGYKNSVATGVDSAGDVVGYVYNSDLSQSHAFLYRNGVMIDLNTLIPANTGWTLTSASQINDDNKIVGTATASDEREQAYVLSILG
jgi:probable HAF family extracellular repeat protein